MDPVLLAVRARVRWYAGDLTAAHADATASLAERDIATTRGLVRGIEGEQRTLTPGWLPTVDVPPAVDVPPVPEDRGLGHLGQLLDELQGPVQVIGEDRQDGFTINVQNPNANAVQEVVASVWPNGDVSYEEISRRVEELQRLH